MELPGYFDYWNYAEKKAILVQQFLQKKQQLNVFYGINIEEHTHEGELMGEYISQIPMSAFLYY